MRAPELDAVVWKALGDWLQQPQMLLKEVATWQLNHQHSQAAQQETARLERLGADIAAFALHRPLPKP